MKHSTFILILVAIVLTACGPSAEQMTATAILAQAQTQTAAPTQTYTPSPTSTPTLTPTVTASPTITPLPRVRAATGDVVPHDPPGVPPVGMPGGGDSHYFESSSGFTISLGSGGIKSLLFLDRKEELPEGAVLEVHFENPADRSTALVVVITDVSSTDIMVESPSIPMSKFECGNYWIDVHVYPDATSPYELSSHTQWNNSGFC
jgi:hypothetical protein